MCMYMQANQIYNCSHMILAPNQETLWQQPQIPPSKENQACPHATTLPPNLQTDQDRTLQQENPPL